MTTFISKPKSSLVGAFVILVALAANQSTWSQTSVPMLINYQGLLTNATGQPEADGEYRLDLRIWSEASATDAASLIWGAGYQVTVVDGRFNVILGAPGGLALSGTPSNLSTTALETAFQEPERYLGITVIQRPGDSVPNGAALELLPRQRLLSSPYAIQAEEAAHAEIADLADSATGALRTVGMPNKSVSPGLKSLVIPSSGQTRIPEELKATLNCLGGRPVLVQLQGLVNEGGNGSDSYLAVKGGSANSRVRILRDGITIAAQVIVHYVKNGGQTTAEAYYPSSSISVIDLDTSPGEHEYSVRFDTVLGSFELANVQLVALEL